MPYKKQKSIRSNKKRCHLRPNDRFGFKIRDSHRLQNCSALCFLSPNNVLLVYVCLFFPNFCAQMRYCKFKYSIFADII